MSHSNHPAAGVSPYLVDLTDRVLFGDIWERPQLSKRDRSLVTMAILMKEFRVDELHSHIRRALDNGVTREEISELIVHLAFYGGWPMSSTLSQRGNRLTCGHAICSGAKVVDFSLPLPNRPISHLL